MNQLDNADQPKVMPSKFTTIKKLLSNDVVLKYSWSCPFSMQTAVQKWRFSSAILHGNNSIA